MNKEIISAPTFSFAVRPVPVPGDLRISWRLAVVVLMLAGARANRASLVKLHILNDAVRSDISRTLLEKVLKNDVRPLEWRMRVEPAFARAIDLSVGSGLVAWVGKDGTRGLELTASGRAAAAQISAMKGVLETEKAILGVLSRTVTEGWAQILTSAQGANRA